MVQRKQIVSQEERFSPAQPTFIVHRRLWGADLNNSPEPKRLLAYFSRLDSYEPTNLPYAIIVEQILSASFFTYVWTDDRARQVERWLGEPLVYTVTHTPFRKFKFSLPWLSLACQPAAFFDCLCAELLSFLFYLYDDILDEKTMRYGRRTAYGEYGPEGNRRSWARAHLLDGRATPVLGSDRERLQLWLNTLDQIEESERQRLTYYDLLPFALYREQSIKRTNFLGAWWQRAAAKAGDNELSSMLAEVYPLCAFTGQLRNDLRNTSGREAQNGGLQFSDFTDGRSTAVTILVRERVSGKERAWIDNTIWNQKRPLCPDEIARLNSICETSGILQALTDLAASYTQAIEDTIGRSALSPEVKSLWLGWAFRQFRVGVTAQQLDSHPATHRFIEAARRLSGSAQESLRPLELAAGC